MAPIIGITATVIHDQGGSGPSTRWAVTETYLHAVAAAGGVPIMLAPVEGDLTTLLDLVDGLLFTGGADIDPTIFGDVEIHPKTYGVSPVRDRFELELIREAAERDIPTLCICRGIQVMNVAFGGTLYQDVADQYSAELNHSQSADQIPGGEPSHRVRVESGSLIASVYGSTDLKTNSFHHQTLRDVPDGLEIAGRSPDGSIEAISMKDKTYFVGLQWHPEMMFERHTEHLRPFTRLVAASAGS